MKHRRRLVIQPEALAGIDEAAAWYEPRRRFLARDFLDVVDSALRAIAPLVQPPRGP